MISRSYFPFPFLTSAKKANALNIDIQAYIQVVCWYIFQHSVDKAKIVQEEHNIVKVE